MTTPEETVKAPRLEDVIDQVLSGGLASLPTSTSTTLATNKFLRKWSTIGPIFFDPPTKSEHVRRFLRTTLNSAALGDSLTESTATHCKEMKEHFETSSLLIKKAFDDEHLNRNHEGVKVFLDAQNYLPKNLSPLLKLMIAFEGLQARSTRT